MATTPSRNIMTPSPLPAVAATRTRLSSRSILWGLAGLLLVLTIAFSHLITPTGADSPQCRPIYMYPSYAHLKGFDTSHTSLASKYNLYLYREQGKDKIPDTTLGHGEFQGLDGIPVLFVPGNAGSFKQVRSIAAQASNIYHEHRDDLSWHGKNLDFFAAHFNEDFTAFHGRTMLDQAEYLNDAIKFILSLYSQQNNPPKSLIVLGHSMGGVVARVMLTLPNYVEDSVNTIVTLAAPHAAAPATFDGDIMRIYAATDKFWRAGYLNESENTVARQRLENVSVISITGGLSDTILPADYTTLRGLVPDTHGFTVYTTGIPGVWTPIDHLAIVWCDQFRKIIASTLLDVVDPSASTRTKPLNVRMRAFRRHLLSGMEKYAHQDFISADTPSLQMAVKNDNIALGGNSKTFTLSDTRYYAFPLTDTKEPNVALLSTLKPTPFDDMAKSSLLLCNISPVSGEDLSSLEETDFDCVDIAADIYQVPNPFVNLQDSSSGGSVQPFYAVNIPSSILKKYAYVVYQPLDEFGEHDFTSISITSTPESQIAVNDSLLGFLFGSSITLPSTSLSLLSKLTYKNIWSSLFAYTLKIDVEGKDSIFLPFMSQSIQDPMETKWHLNLNELKHVTFHGISPFTPYKTIDDPLTLSLWSPESTNKVTVTMKIDILRSFNLLVLRYRLGVASMPTFVILLTLMIQFYRFFETGTFPTFESGLSLLASKSPIIITTLALLVPLGSGVLFQKLFYLLDPIALTSPRDLDVNVNPYYFGVVDKSAWLLGPMFYLLSLAAVIALLLLIRGLLHLIPLAMSLTRSLTHTHMDALAENSVIHGVQEIATGSMKDKRRLTGAVVLLIFVMFYIPYQFAYVVCCLVQAINVIKTHIVSGQAHKEKKIDPRKKNIANFNLSVLMIMLWIIPVNAPVLVVFFHNMAVRWKTPFTSHHNILAILPIIILVGKNVHGDYLPVAKLGVQRKVTYGILGYFAFFTLVYGIRHLYWLHYLLNFLAAWLVILSFLKV